MSFVVQQFDLVFLVSMLISHFTESLYAVVHRWVSQAQFERTLPSLSYYLEIRQSFGWNHAHASLFRNARAASRLFEADPSRVNPLHHLCQRHGIAFYFDSTTVFPLSSVRHSSRRYTAEQAADASSGLRSDRPGRGERAAECRAERMAQG